MAENLRLRSAAFFRTHEFQRARDSRRLLDVSIAGIRPQRSKCVEGERAARPFSAGHVVGDETLDVRLLDARRLAAQHSAESRHELAAYVRKNAFQDSLAHNQVDSATENNAKICLLSAARILTPLFHA